MKKKFAFVIAGGSRGLGKELALEAFKEGFPVALIGRNEEDLAKAKSDIKITVKNSDQNISTHAVDLVDKDMVEKAFQEIQKIHGEVQVLVNNAGTWTGGKLIEGLSRNDVQTSFNLNFFSAFNATKAALNLRTADTSREFSIINIGATSSLQGWDGVASFCLAKGALRSFSQSLAREMGPKGIHVAHLIIDGLIDNERTRKLNPNTPPEKFINMHSIAKTILHVALQEKTCWTFEWDIRPYNESW